VVAMLGVLKSGASYVPLDPDYPAERLRYMLEDTGAPMLITTGPLQSTLPSFEGRVVLVDDLDALGGQPSTAPEIIRARDQLAYTIYTSGSTGRPKGVDVTHGNLAHFTTAMLDRPGLTADDVVLAKTTVAFDPSVVELLTTLVVGARMVIADASEVTTGKRLSRAIQASGATLLQATPATFHMLFEAGWEGRPGLRVLVGGEALPVELARRLVASCGEVWNIYGPTEGTVWSSCWLVPPEVDQIRIGTAMGDTRLLVLDERMQLTPTGVLGELFVGGAGVTRGYRNQPDLTDASYVPNPFPEIPGERLYRTGDIARVLDDGTFESFGRRDNQVQLRGFRIELAEIESVLSEHDDVLRAVVTVVDAGTPDARLVAYVVFAYAAALTVSEVRSYLRERLPSYMVPGLVVEMDEFPVTPSGKVDRRALPDPLARAAAPASTFSAPTTEKERLVADVWLELLDVDRVGKDDNFFQLGGHSLLALRAVAEVAARDGGFIEPRAMFFQTLGQLAAKLQDG
jgi:amino acid adenylation domain-containing protein